jgi:iron-sulfur cluster assembly protein
VPAYIPVTRQEKPMFGIPGKQAVTLTPAAARHIARLMERQGSSGLRIGVRKGGCAGMEYTMDFADRVDPMDELVEQDGARVMIAPMAQMFLFGTEIDYETSLLEAGFKFRNPNVAEACGCGESIKFRDTPAEARAEDPTRA